MTAAERFRQRREQECERMAWLDPDGRHVWHQHRCGNTSLQTMLPWPKWKAGPDGKVTPSVHCTACGFHEFLHIEPALTAFVARFDETTARLNEGNERATTGPQERPKP